MQSRNVEQYASADDPIAYRGDVPERRPFLGGRRVGGACEEFAVVAHMTECVQVAVTIVVIVRSNEVLDELLALRLLVRQLGHPVLRRHRIVRAALVVHRERETYR